MELLMLKDEALSILKKNMEENKKKYNSNKPFINDFFGNNEYFKKTGIQVEEIALLPGIENDAENAKIIHSAMKNLLPIHAREEKIWVYLTHVNFWEYMQSRWNQKNIKERYFFGQNNVKKILTGTKPYTRNGLARLWWGAHIIYDETLSNPYEYIDELFASQDLFVGICERDFGKNKDLVISILSNIRKYELLKIKNSTKLIRELLKDIRFSGGLVVFESLTRKEINKIIEKKVKEQIKKHELITV